MKIPTHRGGRRVSATTVSLVLDHAKQFTQRQWAAFFGVRPRTIERWRSQGMTLDLWSAPTAKQWDTLKADAVYCHWQDVSIIESS